MSLPSESQIAERLADNPELVTATERISGARGPAECAKALRDALQARQRETAAELERLQARKARQAALNQLPLRPPATAPTVAARPAPARPPAARPSGILEKFNRLTGGEASAFYSANRKAIRQAQADAAKPKFS